MAPLFSRRRRLPSSTQQSPSQEGDELDYPKSEGLPTPSDDTPSTGSPWSVGLDHANRPFWWNHVTGQKTYHMYSQASLASPPQPPPPVMYVPTGLPSPHLHPQPWPVSTASAAGNAQAMATWNPVVVPPLLATHRGR